MLGAFLVQNHTATVTIDGTDFPLSDYPEEYLEALWLVTDEPIEDIEFQGRKPDQCPTVMFREWHHNSIALVCGGAALPRRLGIAYELAVGIDPLCGGYFVAGNRNEYEPDEDISNRLHWIAENARGPYVAWWRRRDTGDGILLDDYEYLVVFVDPADDAAFLAAFPGAGA